MTIAVGDVVQAVPAPARSRERSRPCRVLIIGDAFSFPQGTGAAARTCSIARGLREAGAEVQALVTCPTEPSAAAAVNTEARGVYKEIPFEYTTGTTTRPSSFWRRRWVAGRSVARQVAWVMGRGAPFDAVLISTISSLSLPVLIGSLAKARGAVLLFEGCELPFRQPAKGFGRRLYERLYTRWVFKIYDGVLVISTYLSRYFERHVRSTARLIHVPILVDAAPHATRDGLAAARPPYIAYAGFLEESKGIDDLLRAFALITPKHPGLELWIAGGGSREERLRLRTLSQAQGVDRQVRWLGPMPRDEVPVFLSGARVLALPHRSGTYAHAAFPTKLGEYLAAGRPIVTTAVGEISHYLTDGVHAYLVPPDDPAAFAGRLRDVLDHPEDADAMARRGQAVVRQHFDYRFHGQRILAAIREDS